jgi:ribose transport system substrate-binding protein
MRRKGHKMKRKRQEIVLIAAVMTLVVAACGDGGDGADTTAADGAEDTTPTTEAPETTSDTTEPADTTEPTETTGEGEGDATGRAAEPITIGWTPPDITGVFQTATDFFEAAAEEANAAGFDVEVLARSPATHTGFADQLAIVEDFISQGVDVIAISPAEVEALKPGIQQANEAGIPVIMVNLLEEQEDIEVASYIGFDNADAAAVSAYSVLDYFGGPGVLGEGDAVEVGPDSFLDLAWWEDTYADVSTDVPEASGVIIEGIAGGFFSTARLNGFNGVMEGYSNIEMLGEPLAADWNREQGIEAAEDFLTRYSPAPDGDLEFIWAASNEMGIGATLAAERAGLLDDSGGDTPRPEGTVSVFTNDVTPESVSLIQEGRIIAETHHGFAEWGWFGTEFAVRLACGLDVPQQQDIRPRTVWSGNADQFYPDPALPEIDWETIAADCS